VTGAQARRALGIAAGAVIGTGVAVGIGLVGVSIAAARRLIVPPRKAVVEGHIVGIGEGTVTLTRGGTTDLPGRYGMWVRESDRGGYAKVGRIVGLTDHTVTRTVETIDEGALRIGDPVRLAAAYYRDPRELDVAVHDVLIRTPLGDDPAWLVPSVDSTGDWVILVHGRDANRWETIRAVPTFRAAGFTSLIVTYRNDPGAPASPDRRYALGDREWEDIDAAIEYALRAGAKRIVLMGWSMGGALVLQTARRSPHRDVIAGIVLDSAVIDWRELINRSLAELGLRAPIPALSMSLVTTAIGARLVGYAAPISLDRLDGVANAALLDVPVLVLFSRDDPTAPYISAARLAAARPDLVELESFDIAGHVRIWNLWQERYESRIAAWLTRFTAERP